MACSSPSWWWFNLKLTAGRPGDFDRQGVGAKDQKTLDKRLLLSIMLDGQTAFLR